MTKYFIFTDQRIRYFITRHDKIFYFYRPTNKIFYYSSWQNSTISILDLGDRRKAKDIMKSEAVSDNCCCFLCFWLLPLSLLVLILEIDAKKKK